MHAQAMIAAKLGNKLGTWPQVLGIQIDFYCSIAAARNAHSSLALSLDKSTVAFIPQLSTGRPCLDKNTSRTGGIRV